MELLHSVIGRAKRDAAQNNLEQCLFKLGEMIKINVFLNSPSLVNHSAMEILLAGMKKED